MVFKLSHSGVDFRCGQLRILRTASASSEAEFGFLWGLRKRGTALSFVPSKTICCSHRSQLSSAPINHRNSKVACNTTINAILAEEKTRRLLWELRPR